MRFMIILKGTLYDRQSPPIHSSWPRWASSTKSSSRLASCWRWTVSNPAPKAHASNSPARTAPSSTAHSPRLRSHLRGFWIWQVKSLEEAITEAGLNKARTLTTLTTKSKSGRSVRWKTSQTSCPKREIQYKKAKRAELPLQTANK